MIYCKGRDAGGLVGLDAVYEKAGVVRILDTHVYSITYHFSRPHTFEIEAMIIYLYFTCTILELAPYHTPHCVVRRLVNFILDTRYYTVQVCRAVCRATCPHISAETYYIVTTRLTSLLQFAILYICGEAASSYQNPRLTHVHAAVMIRHTIYIVLHLADYLS
jgi:hypothetical protein